MARSVRKHTAAKKPSRYPHLRGARRRTFEDEEQRWSDDQWRLADEDARYAQGGSAEEVGP